VCSLNGGEIRLQEHKEVRWVAPEKLGELDWAAADGPVLRSYFEYLTVGENIE
ncbi:MAG: hypothetical protein IH614_13490, partial [Desulfuromonadales bacterium]|nr:hypothetical protein [Desulfuromonadales bacterium]